MHTRIDLFSQAHAIALTLAGEVAEGLIKNKDGKRFTHQPMLMRFLNSADRRNGLVYKVRRPWGGEFYTPIAVPSIVRTISLGRLVYIIYVPPRSSSPSGGPTC